MSNLKQGGTLLLLALLGMSHVHAASAPFEIDIKELDKQKPAQAPKKESRKASKGKKRRAARAGQERQPAESSGLVSYTVRPGDHIFKILIVRFGMSNDEAERLIPEIVRINKIPDIKKLHVGQTLLIPARRKGHPGSAAKQERKEHERREVEAQKEEAPSAAPEGAPAEEKRAPAPAPASALPAAPPPAAPEALAPAEAAWVCSVTEKEPAGMVDSMLNALSISWTKNKIIHSPAGADTPYSIRVDRYFEYKGERYIVSIGDTDPYSYTLIRILESVGYRTLTLGGNEDFQSVAEKLLGLIGVPRDFRKHPRQGGEVTGFLVRPEDAGGRRVVITAAAVDPQQKWVMKPGCLVK